MAQPSSHRTIDSRPERARRRSHYGELVMGLAIDCRLGTPEVTDVKEQGENASKDADPNRRRQ
jgi:hypothetical protein